MPRDAAVNRAAVAAMQLRNPRKIDRMHEGGWFGKRYRTRILQQLGDELRAKHMTVAIVHKIQFA